MLVIRSLSFKVYKINLRTKLKTAKASNTNFMSNIALYTAKNETLCIYVIMTNHVHSIS